MQSPLKIYYWFEHNEYNQLNMIFIQLEKHFKKNGSVKAFW